MKTIFEKNYDGEGIYDMYRDLAECLNEKYNPPAAEVQQDDNGIVKGTIRLQVIYIPEQE